VFYFPVKPLSASILSSNQPLSADRKYNIECQSVGSRPAAKITWWMDTKALDTYVEKVETSLINETHPRIKIDTKLPIIQDVLVIAMSVPEFKDIFSKCIIFYVGFIIYIIIY
jgi:hypothetical protein